MAESGTQTEAPMGVQARTEFVPAVRRLVLAYLGFATGFSVLLGSVITLQLALGAARFDAIEVAPRMAILTIVPHHGVGMSVSAAALALLVWSHPLGEPALTRWRRRAFATAALLSSEGVVATTVLAVGSSFVVLHFGYGLSVAQLADSLSLVRGTDLARAIGAYSIDACMLGVALWFALPSLTRTTWSFAKKLGATWLGAIMLRFAVGSLLELVNVAF